MSSSLDEIEQTQSVSESENSKLDAALFKAIGDLYAYYTSRRFSGVELGIIKKSLKDALSEEPLVWEHFEALLDAAPDADSQHPYTLMELIRLLGQTVETVGDLMTADSETESPISYVDFSLRLENIGFALGQMFSTALDTTEYQQDFGLIAATIKSLENSGSVEFDDLLIFFYRYWII